jgi:hypothetical protein
LSSRFKGFKWGCCVLTNTWMLSDSYTTKPLEEEDFEVHHIRRSYLTK